MISDSERMGEFQSPGGFVFGVQGWTYGDHRFTSITFFLNGTAAVSDQHGRPIKGVVQDNRPIYFAKCSHAQVIAAITAERIDWQSLTCAGWPQLPYDVLKSLRELPPTPLDELRKIADPDLRKDALRIRREVDAAREAELQASAEE